MSARIHQLCTHPVRAVIIQQEVTSAFVVKVLLLVKMEKPALKQVRSIVRPTLLFPLNTFIPLQPKPRRCLINCNDIYILFHFDDPSFDVTLPMLQIAWETFDSIMINIEDLKVALFLESSVLSLMRLKYAVCWETQLRLN